MDSETLKWVIPVIVGIVGGVMGWAGRQYWTYRESKKQAGLDADQTLKNKKVLLEELINKTENNDKKTEMQRCLDDVNTALLGLSTARVRRTLKEAGLPSEELLISEGKRQLQPQQVAQLDKEISNVTSLPPSDSIQDTFLLAAAQYYLGQDQEAKNTMDRFIEINPNNAYAFNNRGIIHAKRKEYEKALEDYKRAIDIMPNYARAFYNRANAYSNLKKYDEALDDYNRAIELKSDLYKVYNNRGVIYFTLKRYNEAQADYFSALNIEPNEAEPLYNLACLFSVQSKTDDAIHYLEKAIKNKKELKDDAKTDKDFDNISDDPRFKKLIGE